MNAKFWKCAALLALVCLASAGSAPAQGQAQGTWFARDYGIRLDESWVTLQGAGSSGSYTLPPTAPYVEANTTAANGYADAAARYARAFEFVVVSGYGQPPALSIRRRTELGGSASGSGYGYMHSSVGPTSTGLDGYVPGGIPSVFLDYPSYSVSGYSYGYVFDIYAIAREGSATTWSSTIINKNP